jgi:NTE family protein
MARQLLSQPMPSPARPAPLRTPRRASGRSTAGDETRVLVLQGGGALGAYQGGVYEALDAHGLQPQWVAGISIGAINAAIIAGNPPERRVAQLREFWEGVSSQLLAPALPAFYGETARDFFSESSAAMAAAIGIPGFFRPRYPPAPFQPRGTVEALSYYDLAPLEKTLERLIDFDLLNTHDPRHRVRLSVGAVNVTTGNFTYFDTGASGEVGATGTSTRIEPRHIMASGALPPGFAPVEIDGQWYWDGGLVSNTPLQYVLDQPPPGDMLVMQVDLFSARGVLPGDLGEVAAREKDIRYASRTRLNTDVLARQQRQRAAAQRLAARLPARYADDPDLKLLLDAGCPAAVTVLHLINRGGSQAASAKDYEFSRATMLAHWAGGQHDVQRSLADPRWKQRSRPEAGIRVLDLTRPEDAAGA